MAKLGVAKPPLRPLVGSATPSGRLGDRVSNLYSHVRLGRVEAYI